MKTRFESLYGKPPRNNAIRVFRCSTYVHIGRANRKSKFEDKASFVMYVTLRNALHHVNLPDRRALVSTKHVSFDETWLPLGTEENIGYNKKYDTYDNEPQHDGVGIMCYPTGRSEVDANGANERPQALNDNANAAKESTRDHSEEHRLPMCSPRKGHAC